MCIVKQNPFPHTLCLFFGLFFMWQWKQSGSVQRAASKAALWGWAVVRRSVCSVTLLCCAAFAVLSRKLLLLKGWFLATGHHNCRPPAGFALQFKEALSGRVCGLARTPRHEDKIIKYPEKVFISLELFIYKLFVLQVLTNTPCLCYRQAFRQHDAAATVFRDGVVCLIWPDHLPLFVFCQNKPKKTWRCARDAVTHSKTL